MLTKVPVAAIGTIKLNFDLVLHDVLYIPSIYLNLILISSLLKHASYHIIFNNAGLTMDSSFSSHHGILFQVINLLHALF